MNWTELFEKYGEPQEIARYHGKVIEIGFPGEKEDSGVHICFTHADGSEFVRVFPRERVESAKADFLGAEVEYSIYTTGIVGLTILSYVGPTREELLAQDFFPLTEEQLAVLDG